MRLGLQVPSFTWSSLPDRPHGIGTTFARIAREAEASGLNSLWVMDHFFQISMVGPAENEMLEGYSALAFAAAVTEKVKLGTMVTGVTYRHPGILIKTVTTLDALSGGRAYLGIGAAWNEEEHNGLGVPFPPLAERFERLEETLQIAQQMWLGDESPYTGKHYSLARPLNSPQSVQRPHPPILIGGTGEKKTLRMVAQYGDACNIFEQGPDFIRGKLDVLQQHCADQGRDYAEIHKTTLGRLKLSRDGGGHTVTVDQAVDRFGTLAALGIDEALFNMPDVDEADNFELIGELVRQVADIVPTGR
ncbi:LLM class F420-dependent oxidoreductase [Jatrophihabitans telluris]|uniref:LLM class F420-dependent oxidoreductase n=1 Tax=Jatrophihabitans telluris TaxID=2038343 RepID=A0ABY4QZG5_9ACTN|nr:LLM class F420-dependent oxidoreductase [Jatrophihabitans telluris]UQX89066.1 LLM class F420-dependent oxidoreductase [Jatrophihabitans telluris]